MDWTLKAGVDATGITQELSAAIDQAAGIFASFGQPFTVTSLSEGQHMAGSKHYIGQAADLRTRDVDPDALPALVASLKNDLGSGYTVINEGDHIHVQYNGTGTPFFAPTADGLDLSQVFSDLGFPTLSADTGGYQESGVSGGLVVGLVIGGLALWSILRS